MSFEDKVLILIGAVLSIWAIYTITITSLYFNLRGAITLIGGV